MSAAVITSFRRLHRRTTWRAWAGLLAALCAVAASGCAMGRHGVSIDSNSRAPWFNLELLPSKKDRGENYNRSVARSKTRDDQAVAISPAVAPPKKENGLSAWLNPKPEKTPLPLPRTDQVPADAQPTETVEAHPDWWDF